MTTDNINRRKFLKKGILISATAGLAALSNMKNTNECARAFGTKEVDSFPIALSSDLKRYDEKYTCTNRIAWDTTLTHSTKSEMNEKPGFYQVDRAFKEGGWALSNYGFGYGDLMYNFEGETAPTKYVFENKKTASKTIKRAAKFYGANLTGICKYEDVEKWVYNPLFTFDQGSVPAEFPFKPKSVIVMAIEMDYDSYKTVPSFITDAGSGLGYSKMAFVGFSLATFLREMGYKSFAAGNTVSESVPMAIQAGLGELGRNGLLVTQEFGPRVRLVKVFTELELAPDKPIEFGSMKFCEYCKRCAEVCASKSISFDTERSFSTITKSNHDGMKKWYVNVEACFEYWGKTETNCGSCITVCPYNKPNFWHHTLINSLANTPLRPFLKTMDELFGYGQTFNERICLDFWKN